MLYTGLYLGIENYMHEMNVYIVRVLLISNWLPLFDGMKMSRLLIVQ